jgi:diacylglycerol kinase (ATP)
VLAFGGDGTYNEVARGLVGSSTSLGVVPGGTTSVLAYELDVPRPAPHAVAALLAGEDRAMRVARSDHGDLVLLMVSAGPDSYVLKRLRPSFKRLGGRVGVALQAVVEAVGTSNLPRVRVVVGGNGEEAGWVIVGNSRCYAGRHRATPGADPFRGDLEVVAQRGSGRRAAVSFLLGIPSGRHLRRADVVRTVVETVRLEPTASDVTVPYQVDGDVVGALPVEIGVDPRPLMVRIPAGVKTTQRSSER